MARAGSRAAGCRQTDVAIQLAPGSAPARWRADRTRLPGTQVISDPQQALRAGANGTLISKAVLVIVVIALIVGAISVPTRSPWRSSNARAGSGY